MRGHNWVSRFNYILYSGKYSEYTIGMFKFTYKEYYFCTICNLEKMIRYNNKIIYYLSSNSSVSNHYNDIDLPTCEEVTLKNIIE